MDAHQQQMQAQMQAQMQQQQYAQQQQPYQPPPPQQQQPPPQQPQQPPPGYGMMSSGISDPMQQMNGHNPHMSLMLVNVPPNVRTGEQMVVMTPTGQQYMVVVPQGAGPGSQFQIAVPRQENSMMGYPPMQQPVHPGMVPPGGMPQQMQQMQQQQMQQMQMQSMRPMPGSFDMLGRGRGAAGGRGRGRKRKEKDANRAPRQPSQYNLFMKTEVARIKQLQPDLTHKEAFKEAARNWGASEQNPQKRMRNPEDGDGDGATLTSGVLDGGYEMLKDGGEEGEEGEEGEAVPKAEGGEATSAGEANEVKPEPAVEESAETADSIADVAAKQEPEAVAAAPPTDVVPIAGGEGEEEGEEEEEEDDDDGEEDADKF